MSCWLYSRALVQDATESAWRTTLGVCSAGFRIAVLQWSQCALPVDSTVNECSVLKSAGQLQNIQLWKVRDPKGWFRIFVYSCVQTGKILFIIMNSLSLEKFQMIDANPRGTKIRKIHWTNWIRPTVIEFMFPVPEWKNPNPYGRSQVWKLAKVLTSFTQDPFSSSL